MNKCIWLLAVLANAAFAGGAEPARHIVYKTAKYEALIRRDITGHPTNTTWSYPVVLKSQNVARKLNAWLRQLSLEPLVTCTDLSLDSLLRKTDHQVLRQLSDSKNSECNVLQSSVTMTNTFGRYVSVMRNVEVEGLARGYHGLDTLLFDVSAGVPIEISHLFKDNALAQFRGMILELLERERPHCTERRSFEWNQVTFRPPDKLFIEFPYSPAERTSCGDRVEMLSGSEVSEQLAEGIELVPARTLIEAN